MFKRFAHLVLIIFITTSYAYAQESNNIQDSAQPTSSEQELLEDQVTVSESGLVSLDFRDAEIRTVLRILAYKSGVNIVAGPEVTGLITIELKDVPWKHALTIILETYGYAYEQKDKIISVSTVENIKKRREDALLLAEQQPLVIKTIILNYGKASDIIESIEKMKSERGVINYDERTNSIIIRDTSDNIELINGVVEALDRTTPQVLIETKIVETTLTNQENLGIDWTAKFTVSGSKLPTVYPFSNKSGNKYLPDAFPGAKAAEFTYGTINFAQLQAVLEMLRTRTDTNILSNPRIVTLDNKTAKIVVGSQYPVPSYTYNEEQARLQVSGWDYMEIGIIFEVTPHVNNAGFVTLDIKPKITEIIDFVTVENTSLPRLSSESADTTVMIKDSETLVIGGLIKTKTIDTKKKTPIFGDIPIVGLVFQKKEKTITKTDLLIFLTPRIVTPEVEVSAASS